MAIDFEHLSFSATASSVEERKYICDTITNDDEIKEGKTTNRHWCHHARQNHTFAGGCLIPGCTCTRYSQTLKHPNPAYETFDESSKEKYNEAKA